MSENQTKEILQNIDQILSLDLSKLYSSNVNTQQWNNIEQSELKNFVNRIKENLEEIKADTAFLDLIPPHQTHSLAKHLQNVIDEYNNQNLRKIDEEKLTNQHHPALNQLNAANDILRNFGILTEIRISKVLKGEIPDLDNANQIAQNLLTESNKIDESIKAARQWLEMKSDIDQKTIAEQAEAFHDRATSHKPLRGWGRKSDVSGKLEKTERFLKGFRGSWWWMLFTLVFAGVTAGVTSLFIIEVSKEGISISVGEALLRITSLVVPAYMTLFCANQFLYHKRMYDNYMFKYSALKTMNNLVATHKEKEDRILERGIDVLFSEPKTRDSNGKYDTQLLNEVLKMVREQTR